MQTNKKVVQILYSGLGGHGSVAFSLLEGDSDNLTKQSLVFYGVEPVKTEYKNKCQALNISYSAIIKKRGFDILSFISLYKSLKSFKPDVILLHSNNLIIPVFIYALFHNCRIIAVEHTPNSIKTKVDWLWSIFSQTFAGSIVVLTDFYKDALKSKLKFLFKEDKTFVINNGVNTNFYSPSSKDKNKVFTLVMQARFSSSKGQSFIVDSFSHILKSYSSHNLQLRLAGNGETFAAVKRQVVELDLQEYVIFEGMLNEPELLALLQQTDLYIHVSYAEAMSTAILQAMALGLPIIASDIPGINDLIDDGENGLLFTVGHQKKLMEKIIFLIENEAERIRLGKAARAKAVKQFSHHKMFENYYRLFSS